MMNTYTSNTMLQLTGSFSVVATGAPATPTTVTCRITDPNGIVSDISGVLSNPTTGVYTATYTPTLGGVYQYQFMGTGAAVVSGKKTFFVNDTTY